MMPASYSDWPVPAFVVPRQNAEAQKSDPVEPVSRDQTQEWIRQLDDEEPPLPFTDED